MLRPFTYLLFLLLLTTSCEYMNSLFDKDADKVDFTSIDEYPQFPSCDTLVTIESKQKCFEYTATDIIQADLEVQEFHSSQPITDAIIVHFEVDKNGEASLFDLETSVLVKELLPELENVISESIANFPVLTPAKKQNINVTCRFIVPVYIVE